LRNGDRALRRAGDSTPLSLLNHQHSLRNKHHKVTCGSTVKLAHAATDYRLHSHQIAYSRGSQQQSVTAFPESDDAGSYWAVLGAAVRFFRVCVALRGGRRGEQPIHSFAVASDASICNLCRNR
jgi:hypothetical protein